MKKYISRRNFIKSSIILGTIAILSESFYFGRFRISVTKHKIATQKNPQSSLLKIVQISDLHIHSISNFYKEVAKEINMLNPDILFITGDSVDQPDKLPILDNFLSLLAKESKKYSILGNWEHWGKINIDMLNKIYIKHDCKLLINKTSILKFKENEFLITGLDDSTGGNPNIDYALKNIEPKQNHFLLAHSPQYVDTIYSNVEYDYLGNTIDTKIKDYKFSTVFSGHTHGGQIAFFGYAPFRPRGSGRYVNGWYEVNELKMYVNRGIGTSIIPARFMATPEISYFEYSII